MQRKQLSPGSKISMNYWYQKVVVVTGGSSGIGLALAQSLLQKGASVAVCGRSREKLVTALGENSGELLLFSADVSDAAQCEAFLQKTVEKWGGVDVLINNAGISMRALFADVSFAVLRELMDINFWGAVYCSRFALPHIVARKGVVAGISSIAGYRGLPARAGYSASKAALQAFLETLRTELLYTGATALWISPGFTASNIRNVARAANGTAQGETPLDEAKLMSAEECAVHILSAIEKRKRNTVLTFQGKLTVWLNKLFPSLTDKLVYNHFAKEPDSPLKKPK